MEILWFLLVGAVAGWIAGLIMGRGSGHIINIVVGVIGAFLGGYLLGMVGVSFGGGLVGSLLTAVIGAVVLLFIAGLIRKYPRFSVSVTALRDRRHGNGYDRIVGGALSQGDGHHAPSCAAESETSLIGDRQTRYHLG